VLQVLQSSRKHELLLSSGVYRNQVPGSVLFSGIRSRFSFISGSDQKMHYQVSYQDTRQNLLKQRTDHQRTRECAPENPEKILKQRN
jgi:hypothetical protein